MRRLTSVLLSTVLAASALTVVSASPAGACASSFSRADVFRTMRNGGDLDAGVVRTNSGMEQVNLKTFNIEVGELKPTYKIGETVTVEVTVTRPAKEDPLGNGIPMDRPYFEPAEGVIVGIGFHTGRVFLPGAAVTNADGVAYVKIKLESYAPRGTWADASIYAWKVVQESTCFTLQEYGYRSMPHAFKTR